MNDWMSELTYDMLQSKQQEIADVIGIEATLKLCEVYGGVQNLYIPKNDKVREKLRNRQIRMDYAHGGHRVSSIAKDNRLSERTIQKIVKPARPRQMHIEEFEK